MKRNRRVKILATLGPASSHPAMIEKLFRAGADVFRINMSHTPHDGLRRMVADIRDLESRVGRPIGILADLQGPKLRLGTFAAGPVEVADGALFRLDSDPTPGDATRVPLPHPEILVAVEVGHHLLIDDGKVKLECVAKPDRSTIVAKVVVGGRLSDRKGVSLPDTDLPIGALTEKDRSDLDAALAAEVDWIALSFVQRPDDLAEVRKIAKGRAGIMAKIEKPQAIERLAEIIELSDAIMVARGDLGVEMPLETVPSLQKQISRACRRQGKPVIVATQMLESMIAAPVPTRAEVSDVAIAVYESSDAIMLSAESAAGKYPVEAVTMMNAIVEATERDPNWRTIVAAQRAEPEATGADAIAAAARQIGETLSSAAIVCLTQSGSTGLRAARERPFTPVIALSASPSMARRLALVWGLHCVVAEDARDVDDMVDRGCRIAHAEGYARAGQRIIVVGGVPFGTPGSTNMLRIAFVGADGGAA
jgi:pyruvate kinase